MVEVNDLPNLLSEDHVSNLKSLIPTFTLSDEWMISSYTIAKMYVHENSIYEVN